MATNGDLYIYNTVDGGEIENISSVPTMITDFRSAAYLSLFGFSGDKDNFWMNEYADNESEKYQGKLSELIVGNSLTSASLRLAEEAAYLDLKWFIDDGICSDIQVSISIPQPKRINIRCILLQDGNIIDDFNFSENWLSMKNTARTI